MSIFRMEVIMKRVVLAAVLAASSFNVQVQAQDQAQDQENEQQDPQERHHFEGWYLGLGTFVKTNGTGMFYRYPDGSKQHEVGESTANVGGSVVLGVGKRLPGHGAYGSLEVGCDIGPNTEHVSADKLTSDLRIYNNYKQYSIRTETNGVRPGVFVRFGHVNHCWGMLCYVKLGASYAKTTERSKGYRIMQAAGGPIAYSFDSEFSVSGLRFVYGIGGEKGLGKNVTVRAELSVRSGATGRKDWPYGDGIELKQKDSVAARVYVTYHGPIGRLWRAVI
jgi:hypothetical protein